MSVASFSANYRVFVNVLFWLLFALGVVAFLGTVVDVYPDVSFDQAQIIVAWPGASPTEIESSITRKIEEKIEDVRGVDRIVSSSERNRAIIEVKFREDLSEAEFNRDFEDLRASVARVSDLPPGSDRPEIRKITVNELYPLLQVVVTSDQESRRMFELRAIARKLREKLRVIDGVMRVSDLSIPELEWRIYVNRAHLDANGLDLLGVADRLRALHANLSAGTMPAAGSEFSISTVGEFDSPEALSQAIVGHRTDSSPVRLSEIATIEDGLEKLDNLNRYNGQPCITLSLAKEKDGDSLSIRDEVKAVIARFLAEERLPDDVKLPIAIDTTKILEGRINVLRDNLSSGCVLVFVILWLFLGFRNSFLAIIGIPFSFLLGFAFLSLFGVTINAITLFALLLVSGMVVDDALVVLDNIHRRITEGLPLIRAVIVGTEEVLWPVCSASLTTVAAFLPMLIMSGVTGEFMSIIPKTVSAVLLASLLECLLILPAHYLHMGEKAAPRGMVLFVNRGFERIGRSYARLLERLLRRPLLIVASVILLTVGSLWLARDLAVEMFPSDFQAFYCNIHADSEYSLETTAEATREIERVVAEFVGKGVESFTTSIGATFTDDNQLLLKPNVSQVLVYADDEWTKSHSAQELITAIRERTDRLVARPGKFRFDRIKVDTFQDGPPVGKPVAVRVAAPDYDTGKKAAREIEDFLKTLPGVFSVSDNLDEGPREIEFRRNPTRLAEAGIAFPEIGRLLFAANEGLEIGDVVPQGSDDPVVLRVLLRKQDRDDPMKLALLRLPGRGGVQVPLSTIATPVATRAPASLYHYDGERVVLVTADIDKSKNDSSRVNKALMGEFRDLEQRHPGTRVTYGGEFEETQKSFSSLYRAFAISVVLIYAILAAQFRSYVVPLVVMTVVPFSYIGVILGLWLLGLPFTIMTFIAVVGLSGVVVNDSIVLVEFIETARRNGEPLVPAILSGCTTRLRAIFLTTATTVLGLLPMALGLTGYSKIWSPFAATISFGLSLAMILTLFLIPAVYVLVDRRRRRIVQSEIPAAAPSDSH